MANGQRSDLPVTAAARRLESLRSDRGFASLLTAAQPARRGFRSWGARTGRRPRRLVGFRAKLCATG